MTYKINGHCSTCHYCYFECPAKAIGFVGVEYAIDPEKCIDCGKCAEVCPAGVIVKNGAPVAEQHAPLVYDCDLAVIGAGGAGLVAAVRFAEMTGKKVIVLEKSTKVGGNTTLGHNFILRNSRLHREAGLPDLREEHAKRLYENSNGDLSYELVRKATYAVSDAFDWLWDMSDLRDYAELVRFRDRGKGFADFMSWGAEAYFDFPKRSFENLKSTDHSMGPGWMGTFVIRTMLRRCEEVGVSVLTDCAAKELVLDDKGRFSAILAENSGGVLRVNANSCLLASGGFANGKAVMQRILPAFYEGFPVHTFTVASNEGDAILMAEKIGAALDFETVKIPMFGPTHHPFPFSSVVLARNPEMVVVNLNGERYFNEADPGDPGRLVSPIEEQPEKISFAIVDAPTLERLGEKIILDAANDPGFQDCMRPWREQLEEELRYDIAVKRADSIDALAALTGISPDGLIDGIERYNRFCAEGEDTDFEKPVDFLCPVSEAPFYAFFLGRFNEGAEGGIVNDDSLRVLDTEGNPIPGLFAAGDCCKGLLKKNDQGGKFGEMGWAIASGFLAAEEIATG